MRMAGLLAVGALLSLLGAAQAVTETDLRLLEEVVMPDLVGRLDLPQIKKRDLEFNQYVPAYRLRGEPSCEELRAMWRLSKREARRATSTNNLPRSRPYSYGRLIAFAPSAHARPFIYGEPRNFANQGGGGFSPVKGAFNRLRGILGVGAGRPGSLQRVRGMVAKQRHPGENFKGKYDELRDMVVDSHSSKNSPEEVMAGSPSLRSSEMYQPVRRTPPIARYQLEQRQSQGGAPNGFVGPLLAPNPVTSSFSSPGWKPRAWNPRTKLCLQVEGKPCLSHYECACAGQYRCSKSRCKVFPIYPEIEDDMGTWFTGALQKEELGSSSVGSKEASWGQTKQLYQN